MAMVPCTSRRPSPAGDDRELLYSNSIDEGTLTQLRLQPFYLDLAPTSALFLTQAGEQTAINLIQQTLHEEFAEQTTYPLDYVFLADLKSIVFHDQNSTTTLQFQGGVASFTGNVEITQEDANGWVKHGVETKLPLLKNTLFENISLVRYQPGRGIKADDTTLTAAPQPNFVSDAPTQSPGVLGGVQEGNFRSIQAPRSNGLNVWALVGSLVGLTVVVVAVLIVQKRRGGSAWIIFDTSYSESDNAMESSTSNKHAEELDEITVFEDEEDNGSEVAHYTMKDSQSVNSELTMDDSRTTVPEPASKIEPFQQERQVLLKKDMLGNEWSGPNHVTSTSNTTDIGAAVSRSPKRMHVSR
jgi:hypothetical protein